MKRELIGVAAFATAALPAAKSAERPKNSPRRPNIVVIVADDLLSSEISCYGGRNIETRNIDRLAREGTRFTNAYCSTAVSVPVRASMYTGLYPARNGSWANHKDTFLDTKTVCEYMAEEGYRVARTGKNHPVNPDVYHFEEIEGFTVNCVAKRAPYSTDGIREYITHDDKRPFLLFVCSIHPHVPWTWGNPAEFDAERLTLPENCVDNPAMRQIFTTYLAEVRALDNEVGSVVEVLEQAGQLDNTVVMFLGEQGAQIPGGKWTCWSAGVHSAMVARYPAEIEAGSSTDAIVQYEDLLPTFIDIAGGDKRAELDGVSFKKALYGDSNRCRRYAYSMHNNFTPPSEEPYPIRSIRDGRYTLIWNLNSPKPYRKRGVMSDKNAVWSAWKSAERSGDTTAATLIDRYVNRSEYEFYDTAVDPWELNNIVDRPEHRRRIAKMKRALERWMREQGDTGLNLDEPFTNRPRR